MAYIKIDETNRIISASYDFHCGTDEIEVNIPEDISLGKIHEYKYENGDFVYDPMPEPEPDLPETSLEEQVAAIKADVASLTAAIEKGLSL